MKAVHGTLTANEVTTVDLTPAGWPLATSILVTNVSAGSPIYVRLDGEDPIVRGNDCRIVVDWRRYLIAEDGVPIESVKMICADDADFAVETAQ